MGLFYGDDVDKQSFHQSYAAYIAEFWVRRHHEWAKVVERHSAVVVSISSDVELPMRVAQVQAKIYRAKPRDRVHQAKRTGFSRASSAASKQRISASVDSGQFCPLCL